MDNLVKVWVEEVIIPTYQIGEPEKHPVFLEKRVYQGSSGSVYPYPVIEKITDLKVNQTYYACFLENEYLKIMILPELGGRIQMAYDKIKKRHFIYYNEVIKPALVGLTGPWISGGIEFNWPQHHRPSTFEPIDYTIEEKEDGSKTVWCSEVERMTRTKGMIGFTLYPHRAYLELEVKLFNRTLFPQTFLWWANPAVCVNDHYQSVFPPDVNAVFDHGKRDVSTFPIATGKYYKVDYSKGVDISRYKNIPVPTSYMAVSSEFDFVGGYEHDSNGGVLHVANHHISPGKKQWTWGNGDFGRAWDRNLTDNNGPYIELMCGVFTDNQPDFSWIMPFEEKKFKQYFMPYKDLGLVKNATKDALLNFEISGNSIIIKIYPATLNKGSRLIVKNENSILCDVQIDLFPGVTYVKLINFDKTDHFDNYEITVIGNTGKILVDWKQANKKEKQIPRPAEAAKLPSLIQSNEQLFLTGQHLEQYRHATYNATDYYQEALKRDPKDIRSNNAMGLWHLRRGKSMIAEDYFRKAIGTMLERNPNPYDGEPLYNLGVCLKIQGKLNEAYDVLYKSVWNFAWQDSGYFALAQISLIWGDFGSALELIENSLTRNGNNHKSRHLKTIILRKLGQLQEAFIFAEESLALDKFNIGCMYEKYILLNEMNCSEDAAALLKEMKHLLRNWPHNYIEYSLDYSSAGLFDEACALLLESITNPSEVYPMIYYLLGNYASGAGKNEKALEYYNSAAAMPTDFCFPNRLEEVSVLKSALEMNPEDWKALYYLGNFWYANRQYDEALECWEKSVSKFKKFAGSWRNLSLIYYNKLNKKNEAVESLEKAFALDKTDARILMELDQLYKKMNVPHLKRLTFLEMNMSLVDFRDDLYLERIVLCNQLGKFDKAYDLIIKRKFHPWEGGEGKVTGQYVLCNMELGKTALMEHNYTEALTFFMKAKEYPLNLGEGKLLGTRENDIDYFIGCTYEKLGDLTNAIKYFEKASVGDSEPAQAFFYNDQNPDKIFYMGLALNKLNEKKNANSIFNSLIKYGTTHFNENITVDYFAVSLPDLLIWDDNLNRLNKIQCNYLMGLGYLGLGEMDEARNYLQKAFQADINHIGAQVHLNMLDLNIIELI